MRIALLMALVGCKPDDPTKPTLPDTQTGTDGPWQQVDTFSARSGPDGILEVEVVVSEGVDAFQVDATAPSDFVGLERLIDPAGEVVIRWQDWYFGDFSLSGAIDASTRTMAFNWPVRAQDGPLQPGTWIVEVGTTTSSGSYTNLKLEGTIWQKDDADLSAGEVPVHIVYADKIADKPRIVDAVESAVERWRAIWAAHGLALTESYHSSNLDKDLGFAWTDEGSQEVAELAATLPPGELVMIVGDTIGGSDSTYGLAGGIPGPLDPTTFTWVLISWLEHAGLDADFSSDEIATMGETMAHEIGHYQGLYHPVECPYDCVNSWDALDDTADCVGWQDCEAELGANFMFPYPVCDFDSCVPAEDVTADQSGVIHRYVGVQ